MLAQVQRQAADYVNKITSREALEGHLLDDVRFHRKQFVEAIVLIHLNGRMTAEHLSDIVGYRFDQFNRMEVVNDYFLRDHLTDKSWSKSKDILSGRQLHRRRRIESSTLMDIRYER